MTEFSYRASDRAGRIVKGILEGESERKVADELGGQGLIPISICPVDEKASFSFTLPGMSFKRVSARHTLTFTQDLAALLTAGLPLDRSLEILLTACANKNFRLVIEDILHSVEKGHYLSDALAQHPKVFNRFYVSMVKAGEAGGVLEDVLERMGKFLESSRELKDFVLSAMLYPSFLAGVGGISVILLLAFVIPRFSVIFDNMDQSLPLSTELLLTFSVALKKYWWVMALVFVAGGLTVRAWLATDKGRLQLDGVVLKLPVVGNLVRKIELARFSRTLGTLVHSGVPILQALELVQKILSNRVVAASLETVQQRVKSGEKLAAPLEATGVVPPLAIQMIMVGEETGSLDTMLLRVADNYEKIVRSLIRKFVNMLEPLMILIMGVLIGGIVISMLLAIFSMNDLPF